MVRRFSFSSGFVTWACSALIALALTISNAQAGQAVVSASVEQAASLHQPVEALVLLDSDAAAFAEEASFGPVSTIARASPQVYDARMQYRATLLDASKTQVSRATGGSDLQVVGHYSLLPVMHVRLSSPGALERLRAHPLVRSIDEVRAYEPSLAQSLPLIQQPAAAAGGRLGSGTTVAVLDTGADYTRAAFGSCNAPGGSCKVVVAMDFAPSDGLRDDSSMHGTNVAGAVLGVAPGARIAALDVFRNDGLAYNTDLLSAINWVVAQKATYNIASINMSLGGGRYYSAINPTDAFGVAIQSAVNAGVAVAAASGNDGYTNSMGSPAAYSNVISVGAVYDSAIGSVAWRNCVDSTTAADRVTCFSNSANFLTVLGPGALITAAGITMGGTSQASPHVAGALAVLRSAFPSETVAQLRTRLLSGRAVVDHRNGISKPRIDLVLALGSALGNMLTVSKAGSGTGTVTSNPTGINCGSDCTESFASGATVTLAATAATGSTFAGWSGACSGTGTCTVSMSTPRSVTATFAATSSYTLTVSKSGSGSGTVTSNPAGINCGSDCSEAYVSGTSVTLTAAPSSTAVFAGWSGACSGTSTSCTLSMTAARSVTASFNPKPSFNLTVSKSGSGSGTVTSNPAGINCGSDCSEAYVSGTSVTLTAAPSSTAVFAGWSGACSGTSTSCTLSMTAARSVTASFNPKPSFNLTVSKSGSGSGTVTSNPAGINCGSDCSEAYVSGTSVTLTAAANSGSVFAGWSGACTGSSGTCVVSMDAARSVTAAFNPQAVQVNLSVFRSGSGSVVSNPAGINCGTSARACTMPVNKGSTVTLTATPASGWIFSGWSGACSGSSTSCTLTMNSSQAVTAGFANSSMAAVSAAVEAASLPWQGVSSPAQAFWTVENLTSAVGGTAARSGAISHQSATTLRTQVSGPALLKFRWQVSSEAGFDFLSFEFDGWEQAAISGTSGWIEETWVIPAGTHTLAWVYRKDASLSAGTDRGHLDNVRFTPLTAGTATDMSPGAATVRMNTLGTAQRRSYGPILPK